MGVFGYMRVYCPICKNEMDGMRGYGREAKCCCRDCYAEWEWRKTLAIVNKPYVARSMDDKEPAK